MECTITRLNNQWGFKAPNRFVPICEDKFPLLAVIRGVQKHYPKWKIWIDEDISENPWIKQEIRGMKEFDLAPYYEDVQAMLDFPEPRTCFRCQAKSWFNVGSKAFKCPVCRALTPDKNGYFIK